MSTQIISWPNNPDDQTPTVAFFDGDDEYDRWVYTWLAVHESRQPHDAAACPYCNGRFTEPITGAITDDDIAALFAPRPVANTEPF